MAGSAQGIRAGRAYVEIGADDSQFEGTLQKVSDRFKAWGRELETAGAAVAGVGLAIKAGLGAAVAVFSVMGQELERASQRTGIAVDRLSELKGAAELTGITFQQFETGIRKMQVAIYAAAGGSKEAAEAFQDLGVTIDSLRGKQPDEQMLLLADAFAKIEDPAKRTALAVKLFGRNGSDMLPMLQQGSASLNAITTELRRLGVTMSGEDAKAAEDLSNQSMILWDVLKATAITIGAALAPSMQALVHYLTEGVAVVKKFIDQHRELVVEVSAVATGIIGVGAAMVALGFAFQGVGVALGLVASAAGVAATLFTALVSPTVLLAGAALALGAYLLYSSGVALSSFQTIKGAATSVSGYLQNTFYAMWTYLQDVWKGLKHDALLAFDGIKGALSASDWTTAGQIVWTALQLEFEKGVKALYGTWVDVRGWLTGIWSDGVHGMLAVWDIGLARIETGMETVIVSLKGLWASFAAYMKNIWNDVKLKFEQATNWAKVVLWDPNPMHWGAAAFTADAKSVADHSQQQQAIENEKNAELAKLRSDSAARIAQINAERDKALADLAAQRQKTSTAPTSADVARQEAMQRRIDELTKQLGALAANGKGEQTNKPFFTLKPPAAFQDGLPSGQLSFKSAGTFNAAALFGLAGGDLRAERTAKATERTAKATEQLAKAKPLTWGP